MEALDLFVAFGLPRPLREHQFAKHLGRKFAFDFAWPHPSGRGGVALEQEGGLYGVGKPCPACKQRKAAGHGSIERKKTDLEKYNLAACLGWRVLRCFPGQIESAEIMPVIEQALRARG